MACNKSSVCRLCRREKMKLFLKGDRCYADKCSVDRRAYAPGQHGMRRSKTSEYGTQLREKQKAKRMYGLLEKQFRNTFFAAERQKGITGDNLLVLLERRLDNMVYKMGFARSRNQARQLIAHNHFLVNGKRTNISSYILKQGDTVSVKEGSGKIKTILESVEGIERRGLPEWLMLDKGKLSAKVMALPNREQLITPLQEHLIVELYSK